MEKKKKMRVGISISTGFVAIFLQIQKCIIRCKFQLMKKSEAASTYLCIIACHH